MKIFTWLSGALICSGLWLFDEILTEAMYCGKDCLYPIPLIGSYTLYQAEGLGWVMIFLGVACNYTQEIYRCLRKLSRAH